MLKATTVITTEEVGTTGNCRCLAMEIKYRSEQKKALVIDQRLGKLNWKMLKVYLSRANRFPTTRKTISNMPKSTKWIGVKLPPIAFVLRKASV